MTAKKSAGQLAKWLSWFGSMAAQPADGSLAGG